MPKRYCIFSAQYLPHMGGVERYTYNLAKKLIERGNQVTIVSSHIEGTRFYEISENIEIYRMPCFNLMDSRYPVLKCNKAFTKLNRHLAKHTFDFIIVNTRFYIHSLYGMRFAKKRNIPCIIIEHGSSHLAMHQPILDFAENIYEHAITKMGTRYCNDYYGVSKACNDWLRHFHIQAKGVLHNSINLNEVEKLLEHKKRNYRDELQIPKEAVVIAFTGRLLEEKGIIQLVKAVERICRERNDVYLILAGDGKLEKWVNEKSSSHIVPLGKLDYEDVIHMLDIADIFCLPSFSEGFSTSILEAAACGCYIVTTKRGGAKELVINEKHGIIMKDNQDETIYQGLKAAIEDENGRADGIGLTYKILKEKFTWDCLVEKICKIAEQQ